MNTIKAGVKALHLDTGETELFSTVREAAEYMARYRISEQKIRQVLSRGKTGLDHVRGWTFAYVGEPYKVTDSSGRVRNRERHVYVYLKTWRMADDYEDIKCMFSNVPISETLWFVNRNPKLSPKLDVNDLVRLADTEEWFRLSWGELIGDPSTYVQYVWA